MRTEDRKAEDMLRQNRGKRQDKQTGKRWVDGWSDMQEGKPEDRSKREGWHAERQPTDGDMAVEADTIPTKDRVMVMSNWANNHGCCVSLVQRRLTLWADTTTKSFFLVTNHVQHSTTVRPMQNTVELELKTHYRRLCCRLISSDCVLSSCLSASFSCCSNSARLSIACHERLK